MSSAYFIGSYFERFIKKRKASGRCANASEAVRETLRLM